MSCESQTSVEQINLMAAQLRYKIDSTLQLNAHHRHQVHTFKDEVQLEIAEREVFPDIQSGAGEYII
jgi:hypothetical protein